MALHSWSKIGQERFSPNKVSNLRGQQSTMVIDSTHVFPSHYSVTQELFYRTPDMKEDVVAATGITPISSLMHLFPSLD
eukprot:scaffold642_cov147-Skeletonema_menzelii.AAC.1